MTQDFTIVALKPEHLAQVESWTTSQNAAKSLLKLPGTHVSQTSSMHGWAAVHDNEVLAVATVNLNEEHVGYLECRVKSSAQRRGVGSELVAYVLNQSAIEALVHLHAVVDGANIAAQKTLDGQGFTRVGYAPDGRLEFARHKV